MKYYLIEIKNPLFTKPDYYNWGELTKEELNRKLEYWTYPNSKATIITFDSELEMTKKKFEILDAGMKIYG